MFTQIPSEFKFKFEVEQSFLEIFFKWEAYATLKVRKQEDRITKVYPVVVVVISAA